MKKILLFLIVLLPLLVLAQIDGSSGFSEQNDYKAFKQKIEQQFKSYQDSVNQRFIQELRRQWVGYEVFQGEMRPQKPKPVLPYVAPKDTVSKSFKELPIGTIRQPLNNVKSSIFIKDEEVSSPRNPYDGSGDFPGEELQPNMLKSYKVSIDFYHQPLTLSMPESYSKISMPDISEKSVANLWKLFSQEDVSGYVSQCQYFEKSYNYNDWAVYEMICDFANTAFPQKYAVQTVFSVFLLNQLGIDAQVGRKSNRLVVLLPSKTTIYSVPFIKRNEISYYIFSFYPDKESTPSGIYTYSVKYQNKAKTIDLNISQPIRFPFKPADVTYTTTYWCEANENPVPLKLNQNMLDFYAHYPQVDMMVYASAQMTQELMDWVERQIVPVLSEETPETAVSLFLDYIQQGFEYATDNQQFGYEKPFFCEENFYYTKNDCEDRVILLSYFVRNFVKADIVLLDYPDHIAAAVAFSEDSDIIGDYYLINGRKYYVCDPTYIGAGIGETMPRYKDVRADIIILGK